MISLIVIRRKAEDNLFTGSYTTLHKQRSYYGMSLQKIERDIRDSSTLDKDNF